MIFHITQQTAWETAKEKGRYEAPSLQSEGFIHTCRENQLAAVQERYYKGQKNLVLLHIDEDKLASPLKMELAPSVNEVFPHIYGPVNLDSVVQVISF